MNHIKLVPVSRKAKNILNNAGTNIWIIIEEKESVGFSNVKGPWVFVRPNNGHEPKDHARWVAKIDDKDFKLESV